MVFFAGDGASRAQQGQGVKITFNTVDSVFFRLLGIPILLGRNFTEHDNKTNMKVAVINDTMAKTYWPNENPIGKSISIDSPTGQPVQIIGVVRDSKRNWIGESPAPHLYLAFAQEYRWEATLAAKCTVRPAILADSVRRELRALGITPRRSDVSTMAEFFRDKFADQEMMTKMLVFFGLLGLGLAGVGLYGVLTFTVNRRAHDIGIRMALGARRADVVRTVMWRAWSLTLVGSVLGLPIALAVARILRGALYGVRPIDPASICVSLIVLLGVASLACYLPARRAAGVDPMEALRYE
jgi:putative ABC transport system permease protein